MNNKNNTNNEDIQTEQLLRQLESTSKEFWNISFDTANFINMLIKMTNKQNILEIGTSNGYSGIWIAKALKETQGHLTTIEYYEKRIKLAKENFKKCNVDDIITIKQGSAIDVLNGLNQEFDCVFIDANKREYIDYYNITDKLLKKNGIILADNIISHAEKVAPFVEAIKNNPKYQVQILDLPAGLLLAYKLEY